MKKIKILKPQILNIESLGKNYSKITLEPLQQGYGHTLGNALRRVLLSSITGCAVTEVSITGVLHEYSILKGVREDIIDILLNLKGLIFRLHNCEKILLTLKKNNKGVILGSDINLIQNVELMNPNHIIANLSKDINFEMFIKVRKGLGYSTEELYKNKKSSLKNSNRMFLDISFSPVRRVFYNVDISRYKEKIDFDKLIINIETNGSITPEEALKQSIILLINQLSFLKKLKKNIIKNNK